MDKNVYYYLTKKSTNKKTGPIPVVTSSQKTCPDACPFKHNGKESGGCYADTGPLKLFWDRVTRRHKQPFGKRNKLRGLGISLSELLKDLRKLPRVIEIKTQVNGEQVVKRLRAKVRLWQAGDMPGINNRISIAAVKRLVKALRGMEAFGYTHKPLTPHNIKCIRYCNDSGVTINLSANNPAHADELADLGVAPVVTTLPSNTEKNIETPAGRKIVVCPAVLTENIQCFNCGGNKGALCARVDRDYIIGFPAHGSGAKKVTDISNES